MNKDSRFLSRHVHEDDFPACLLDPWLEAGVGDRAWWAGEERLAARPLRVAAIGTRKPSERALVAMEALCTCLTAEGATIVSGAAAGTDLMAHRAALEAGGCTIGCLPFGLGFPGARSPGGRSMLWEEPERALLLSPFSPGQAPTRQTPVIRNRLIAALACAVVVGEAKPDSGTYHCASFALRTGRPVFVLEAPEGSSAGLVRLQRGVAARNGARVYTADECHGGGLAREVCAAARRFTEEKTRRRAEQQDLLEGDRP